MFNLNLADGNIACNFMDSTEEIFNG